MRAWAGLILHHGAPHYWGDPRRAQGASRPDAGDVEGEWPGAGRQMVRLRGARAGAGVQGATRLDPSDV